MRVLTKIILIGIGATLATDIWSLILKLFNVHSHGLLLVGNWITSRLECSLQDQLAGQELMVGRIAHYCLGISFAFLLILIYGKRWLEKPTILTALVLGLITFLISLFIVQPVLGFGPAFSKMPTQFIIISKLFGFHLV